MHKSAMQMHAREVAHRADVKPHQCQQCLKSFSSNHQLVQHIRVHTGEKPYKCSYCDRRFKQLSHVQQHTRLHTDARCGQRRQPVSVSLPGRSRDFQSPPDALAKDVGTGPEATCTGERPYKCHLPECGRAFIQLSNLQQHLRNHDAQVERAKNRPFHCNICGKGFATESSLRTHTSKELQLRVPVLQQHAALIGGPNATSCPICHKLFLGGEALMEHMKHTHKDPNASGVATGPYLAKRRTANHPCPVCGKHYVNEGSLRKHLACHPETSQLTTSLRMWPCSVCQAVFTHESGLLSHMEHMRMDPKHQFAAQYVLSRAAAERRERESLLAAAVAASSASGLAGLGGGGPSPMCASPSAHSDSSSGGGRLSSAGSEPGGLAHNNNNNNNNNNKLGELLSARAAASNGLQQQYGEELHSASRMAAMAAIVGQSSGVGSPGPGGLGVDTSAAVAVQAAAVNLAAAMRMNASGLGGGIASPGGHNGSSATPPAPADGGVSAAQAQAAMNAAMRAASMADSMRSMDVAMRSSIVVDSAMRLDSMGGHHHGAHQPHQAHHNHQQSQEAALRIHQAEALLRSQAEAALRLAVSQAAAVAASNNGGVVDNGGGLRHHNMAAVAAAHNGGGNGGGVMNHHHAHHNQVSPDLSEALRLQEQRLEQALRLHGGDPRALGFSLSSSAGSSQSQQQNNP
ncbi:flt3-interacting zinc finger protein 1-like isoform X3 [Bacillus rossius redtenbacheri]